MDTEPDRTAKLRGAWLLALAVLLPVGVLLLWWTRMDLGLVLDHLTNDDTFLYLQVVRNLADTGQCSFDGIHVTTGIQPLWTALLVPVAALVEDRVEFLRVVLMISVVLNLGAGLLLARTAAALAGHRLASFLAAGLWGGYMLGGRPALLGMECGLTALTLAALLAFLALRPPVGRPSWGWRFALAALAAAVFLSRTDSVLILAVLGVLVLILLRPGADGWRSVVKTGAGLAGLTLLFVLPYLVFNLVVSGRVMPVSGAVKMWYVAQDLPDGGLLAPLAVREVGARILVVLDSGLPLVLPIGGLVDIEVNRFGLFAGTALALLAVMSLTGPARRILLALLVACALHVLAFTALLGRFGESTWYYVPEYVSAILLLAVIAGRLAGGRPRAVRGLAVGLVVLLAAQAFLAHREFRRPDEDGLFRTRHELAQRIRNELPPDAVLASWNAGQLGYFCDRPVVNLDGLVNDAEYFEFLRGHGDVREYLRDQEIDFVADYNRRDASVSRSRRWDASATFRGLWDLEALDIVIRHHRFLVFRVPAE